MASLCSLGFSIFTVNTLSAQFSISGTVKGPNDQPIPYSVVGIKNTFISAQANHEGFYKLSNLNLGRHVLLTNSIGYKTRVDTIELSADLNFDVTLTTGDIRLDEILVSSTRAAKESGMAYTEINKDEIKKQNLGQDIPMILNLAPSVVVNTDAGNEMCIRDSFRGARGLIIGSFRFGVKHKTRNN